MTTSISTVTGYAGAPRINRVHMRAQATHEHSSIRVWSSLLHASLIQRRIACFALLFLLNIPVLQARETITWANLHFPPWMILQGQHHGEGVWDLLLQELQAGLPEYEHKLSVMNNVRFELLASRQENVCKAYYFKTPEREKILYYSMPTVVFASNHILMRSDKAAELGNPTSYSLQRLLEESSYSGAVVQNRSYGGVIDGLLSPHLKSKRLTELTTDNQGLFQYLHLGRTDFILEFPAVRAFFEENLDLSPEIESIRIDEAEPYNVTYVTCAKTPWGKQVINRVDEILRGYLRSDKHRRAVLRWYDPTQQHQLDKAYERLVLQPLLEVLNAEE